MQAAGLTAQKLSENGIKSDDRIDSRKEDTDNAEKEEVHNENDEEKGDQAQEDDPKDKEDQQKTTESAKDDISVSNLSDLEELLFCRSPNQIKVIYSHGQ